MPEEIIGLADVLREFRERRGVSKRALSQKAQLSPSYVGKLEAGEIEPSLRSFLQIARALGLNQHEVVLCIRCALLELDEPSVSHP